MKKIAIPFLLLFLGVNLNAQEADTSYWTRGGVGTLTFSQVSLYQWTAGGEPSFSGAALLSLYANYLKDNVSWQNTLDLGYGLIRQGKDENQLTKKSNDRIEFSSQYGRKASEKWFYSGLLNFKTQFTKGYNYPNDVDVISDFFAPAYLTASLGMEYKASDNFQVFLSPVTGKFTIVTNDSLSAEGAFGVDPGKKFRAELGGFVKAAYKINIMENVDIGTKIDLFSNYLHNPQNIDVNAELLVAMKINEFLSANLNVLMIYDDDINLLQSDDTIGPGLQVKEVFGVGLSYTF